MITYRDIQAFYNGKPERRESETRGFGSAWRWDKEPELYRAFFVIDTGEIVAECTGADGQHQCQVILLASGLSLDTADIIISGWRDFMGVETGLNLLKNRAAAATIGKTAK